ncbi:MAG: hypothetical protein PHF25_08970, partial [Candidatus Margulisbacteria bacterium]|nr:hypothetical protein [Candidatus Margulisiibacteriota bacterium]
MDQEQHLKKRMQKALRIADELNYMIEHTLRVPPKEPWEDMPVLDISTDYGDAFQGPKLYKLMKDFLDIPLSVGGTG